VKTPKKNYIICFNFYICADLLNPYDLCSKNKLLIIKTLRKHVISRTNFLFQTTSMAMTCSIVLPRHLVVVFQADSSTSSE